MLSRYSLSHHKVQLLLSLNKQFPPFLFPPFPFLFSFKYKNQKALTDHLNRPVINSKERKSRSLGCATAFRGLRARCEWGERGSASPRFSRVAGVGGGVGVVLGWFYFCLVLFLPVSPCPPPRRRRGRSPICPWLCWRPEPGPAIWAGENYRPPRERPPPGHRAQSRSGAKRRPAPGAPTLPQPSP